MVAPALGLIGLAVLLVMTIAKLPLLVGGSTTLAAVIGVLLVGVFLGGVAVAALRPHTPSEQKEIAR
jgi:hypothetical protein